MIVGIDLGTSTSEIAVLRNGRPELIRDVPGSIGGILPSVVALNAKGQIEVGTDAVQQSKVRPEMVVHEIKRHMGSDQTVTLGAIEFSPQEISAAILRRLKEAAEHFLGEPITEAVITVPANFNDRQRRATEQAAALVDLRVRRFINEPTAAAISYGENATGVEERLLVYDLGGGTLDVTVLELSEGVHDVLASAGIPKLGGKDFDDRLIALLVRECERIHDVPLTSVKTQARIREAALNAKIALSANSECQVAIDFIGLDKQGEPLSFEMTLTRRMFEDVIRDLVESSTAAIDEALRVKNLSVEDIDTVLLVGGATRIPLVREVVSTYFGGRTLRTDVSPDEAVALGAAVLGGIEGGQVSPEHTILTDVSPYTIGVAVSEEEDGERMSNLFSPVLLKNTTIPRTVRKTFLTMHDWQDAVRVRVFQGEERLCSDNIFACEFTHPMASAPAGAEVHVEISYDLSGKILIEAIDASTGARTRHECVLGPGGLAEAELQSAKDRLNRNWKVAAGAQERAVGGSGPQDIPPPPPSWERSPLWTEVAALHSHAIRRLDELDEDKRTHLRLLLDRLESSASSGNGESLRKTEGELTEFLFDLE